MSELIPNNDLASLLTILKHSPMRALGRCRDQYQSSEKAHHAALYDALAFKVGFVLHLQRSERDRLAFLNDEFWKGKPQAPKEENLTRLATMYVLGVKESRGARYDQAVVYTKVVDHFLDIDIAPEDIPAALRRKPIYKLLDEINERKAKPGKADDARRGGGIAAKENGSGSHTVSLDPDDDDLFSDNVSPVDDEEGKGSPERGDLLAAGESMGGGGSGRSTPHKPIRFDRKVHVALRGDEYLQRILAIRRGQQLWVCIERADDDKEEWKDIRVVDLMSAPPVSRSIH